MSLKILLPRAIIFILWFFLKKFAVSIIFGFMMVLLMCHMASIMVWNRTRGNIFVNKAQFFLFSFYDNCCTPVVGPLGFIRNRKAWTSYGECFVLAQFMMSYERQMSRVNLTLPPPCRSPSLSLSIYSHWSFLLSLVGSKGYGFELVNDNNYHSSN